MEGERKKSMYRKDSEGWLKHTDFIILDMICLQLAYVLAYAISGYGFNPYETIIYRNMAVFLELADLVMIFAYGTMKSVLKRGYYRDFVVTLNHAIMVGALAVLYLFLLHEGQDFSRLTLMLTIIIYLVMTYVVRELWKKLLRKQMKDGGERKLLIVTSEAVAEQVVLSMQENNYARFSLAGVAVIDADWTGREIHGVPVVANEETAAMYVCQEWIDEVLIVVSEVLPYPSELIEQLSETGVTIHLNLAKITSVPGKKQFVEKVGNYTVLTTSINYASTRQLMLKRLMDIAGGLVGCIFTGIICIFVGPAIYIASPGPIFFAQERVGKNGKKFKMYKFRSMYMDAEERKAELMKDNKLGDGKMFKLDFDPRVIGNKILPDGTHKTGIGDFMLNAFYALKGKYADKKKLADEAIYLERELCQEAGGWQDQIAASFGGFNRINFTDEGYDVLPLIISPERKKQLNQNLMMFFTGFTRFSSDVQKANAAGKVDKTAQLKEMLSLVDDAEKVLTDKTVDLDEFGRMLDHTWKLKRQTGNAVSTSNIDILYEKGIKAGALGGKLLGAGGGGFLVFYVQPEKQAEVREAMKELMYIPFSFEDGGTRVIHYTPESYEPLV